MGSSGALVAAAQRRLDEVLPLTHLVVDGIYGPLTRQAVREFQHRHNLDATGAIDVRTWAVMFRAPVLVFGGAAGTSSVAPATTAAAGVSAAAPVSSPAGQATAHRYFAGAAVDRHRAGTAAATGETAGRPARQGRLRGRSAGPRRRLRRRAPAPPVPADRPAPMPPERAARPTRAAAVTRRRR